jgi:preprotein translocase subunit SecE
MAKAKKTATKRAPAKSDSSVVRISATDDAPKKQKTAASKKAVKKVAATKPETTKRKFGPLSAIIGYFKGAWYELKQVRWPTRKATWGLTIAVLLFSAFFVVFILLIDAGFKYLFELLYKQ